MQLLIVMSLVLKIKNLQLMLKRVQRLQCHQHRKFRNCHPREYHLLKNPLKNQPLFPKVQILPEPWYQLVRLLTIFVYSSDLK